MNEPEQITIERLSDYSTEDAAVLGHLFAQLTPRYDGTPVDDATLLDIIDSPLDDILVARRGDGTIVGTATISITIGPVDHRRAWLDIFVVDDSVRGLGIGSKLWNALIDWCREYRAGQLAFTPRANKPEAHEFYLKRGAIIKDTNYFVKQID